MTVLAGVRILDGRPLAKPVIEAGGDAKASAHHGTLPQRLAQASTGKS